MSHLAQSHSPAAADASRIQRHRAQVFDALSAHLRNDARAQMQQYDWRQQHASVWQFGVPLGIPTTQIGPDGRFLQVFWPSHLSASISLRLTDCRIGIIVPRDLVTNLALVEPFDPYAHLPENQRPTKLFRMLGEVYAVLDFIFTQRLGDFSLLRAALGGHPTDTALLADGLAAETTHIVATLMHHLSEAGVYLGAGEISNMVPIKLTTRDMDAARVAQTLGIAPAHLIVMGPGDLPGTAQYTVLVPPEGENAMLQRVLALQHGEFLQRHAQPQTFDFQGLKLHASPGVYHPVVGSSTEFVVRALSENLPHLNPLRIHLPQPSPMRVLDLGCWCGAIALWLKRLFPSWQVFGSDIDPKAIADARANAQTNELDVEFAQADLLDGLPKDAPWNAPWDIILWNYPFWQVRPEGTQTAPYDHIGVDENGDLLRRLIPQIPDRLTMDGAVYLSYSTMADADLLRSLCEASGLQATLLAQEGDPHYARQLWKIAR